MFTNEAAIKTLLDGVYIEADRYKLSQVIRNLVSNAIKFTPEGGTISVNATITHDSYSVVDHISTVKRSLRIQVSDSGCGIAKVS